MTFSALLSIAFVSSSPAAAEAAMPAKADPLVCRREAPTGTRFAKRICLRQSEIDAREKLDQAEMKERVDRAQMNPAGKEG
jgi:hypothetical protein